MKKVFRLRIDLALLGLKRPQLSIFYKSYYTLHAIHVRSRFIQLSSSEDSFVSRNLHLPVLIRGAFCNAAWKEIDLNSPRRSLFVNESAKFRSRIMSLLTSTLVQFSTFF